MIKTDAEVNFNPNITAECSQLQMTFKRLLNPETLYSIMPFYVSNDDNTDMTTVSDLAEG